MAKSKKSTLIKHEMKRLEGLFAELPENELNFIRPQLQNAAFMKVTLDELQEAINQNGATDEYQNGANQFGSKASAELQAYNTTVKNYNSLMKELKDRLPKQNTASKLAQMMADE